MSNDLLNKWIRDELTEEEMAAFRSTKEYADIDRIVSAMKTMKAPDLDLDQAYQEQLNLRKASADQGRIVPLNRYAYTRYMGIAASILIVSLVAFFFFDRDVDYAETLYSEAYQETYLPDSSLFVLHKASEITFAAENWDENRTLKLNGEAFFDVRKGGKFSVQTPAGVVQVLGTEFNIRQREDLFEVICFEGRVKVVLEDEEYVLQQGEMFKSVGTSKARLPITSSGPDWLKGESSFNDIPVKYVVEEIERLYDVKISGKVPDARFTGKIPHTNLHVAMLALSNTMSSRFEIKGDTVIIGIEME